MADILQPGRWRGLNATSTPGKTFAVLAFDQRNNYRQLLPEGSTFQDAVDIKRETATVLSRVASAVLLDSSYGLDASLHMAGGCGLLMALERSGYTGDSTYRRTEFDEHWTVDKIKRMGASAVKLLIYYHPDSGALAEEIETLITDVNTMCRGADIPLFVEPLSYSLDSSIPKSSAAFAEERPRLVIETARRLSALGPDVLKLEFPVDAAFDKDQTSWAKACAAVSEASSVPWALLSAGVNFEIFEQQVRVACQQGASGFIGGRAIWKECVPMSAEDRQRFLVETATDRFTTLLEITDRYARPWTDFYQPVRAVENWYEQYD